jgi:NAD(P)-dependent dehydrogenase (short-subunit alcohol dehydrogenase family)
MADMSLDAMKRVMDVNVWANKPVLDTVFAGERKVDRVVAISSGAAVSGSRGWNGYAISKAALNMFIRLYAAERPETQFISLAPGLIDTGMQAYMRSLDSDSRFPTVDRLKQAHGTPAMPGPEKAASQIAAFIERLRKGKDGLKSGAFLDIRDFA